MPKVHKKNKYIKKYSEETLQEALRKISNGMPKATAAVKYRIPRATLQFRLSEKFKKVAHGPNTYLTVSEESVLEKWIVDCHRKGFPKRREDIQASVKSFLDENPRPNPFTNNLPGDHWYQSFLRRHPSLSNRTPEAVTSASGNVSENDIRNWFHTIENYLKEKNYFDILSDPSRVYNGDETYFGLCPKEDKVLAPKGAKNVYQIEQGPSKTNITVMFTFSAVGVTTPPMIVYAYKRLPKTIAESVPDGWGIATSEKGWMQADIFHDYISKILYPYLVAQHDTFPIIMFVDGHKTHLTYQLSQLCTKLQIILVALYPNATRILQPADVSSFKPLKNSWKRALLNWKRQNPFEQLSKSNFAPILKEAVDTLKPSAISNGFKVCGLCPWNANSIDYSKCLGKKHTAGKCYGTSTESINLADFCDMCDQDTLQLLKEARKNGNSDNSSKSFKVLLNIFNMLHPNNEEGDNSQIVIDETFLEDMPVIEENPTNDFPITENLVYDIEAMPVVLLQEDASEQNIEPTQSLSLNLENNIESIIYNAGLSSTSDSIPSTSQNSNNNRNIEDCLPWAKTPERKGTRNTQRSSFVISSSVYKRELEEKDREKNEKEQKKLENKAKRLLKCKENSLKEKNVKRTAKNKVPKETFLFQQKPTILQDLEVNKILNKENDEKQPHDKTTELGTSQKHVRNLSVLFDPEVTEFSSPPKNNIFMNKGICFTCTRNFSLINFGIKCQKCSRTFHKRCLEKYDLYTEYYVCKTCLK